MRRAVRESPGRRWRTCLATRRRPIRATTPTARRRRPPSATQTSRTRVRAFALSLSRLGPSSTSTWKHRADRRHRRSRRPGVRPGHLCASTPTRRSLDSSASRELSPHEGRRAVCGPASQSSACQDQWGQIPLTPRPRAVGRVRRAGIVLRAQWHRHPAQRASTSPSPAQPVPSRASRARRDTASPILVRTAVTPVRPTHSRTSSTRPAVRIAPREASARTKALFKHSSVRRADTKMRRVGPSAHGAPQADSSQSVGKPHATGVTREGTARTQARRHATCALRERTTRRRGAARPTPACSAPVEPLARPSAQAAARRAQAAGLEHTATPPG